MRNLTNIHKEIMGDNGKLKGEQLLLKVTLGGGSMKVTFGPHNMALLAYALRRASLQLDNQIIASEAAKKSPITIPKDLRKRLQ